MLLVAVDLVGVAGVAAVQGMRQNAAQRHIQQRTARNGEDHLADNQQHNSCAFDYRRDDKNWDDSYKDKACSGGACKIRI